MILSAHSLTLARIRLFICFDRYAFTHVALLSPVAEQRAQARTMLLSIVGTIVRNGFVMNGLDGQATTWGRWDPAEVNFRRTFSDERGLQSLQMLSMLAAASNVSNGTLHSGGDADDWHAAYATLTNATNDYARNMLNLKIETPCDDNFSDDELTFLPYATWLVACADRAECPFDATPLIASLQRTHRLVHAERSSLWEAIAFAAATNDSTKTSAARDVKWNLRSWPLELIDWPMNNSLRQDIFYNTQSTRFGKRQTTRSRPPLPANERGQGRWNANPYDISPSGHGMSEFDPGAWLLPYWYARFIGLLDASD